MGGAEALLKQAREAFTKGEYRWVAQLVNHLVFAEPDNQAARQLQADALEQLGYQSENATWRNVYLMGAFELRNGVPQQASAGTVSADIIRSMTPALFFDYLGVRLNADKAQGHDMRMNWRFSDLGEDFALTLRNGVLTYREGRLHEQAVLSVTLSKTTLDRIALQQTDFPGAIQAGDIRLEGQPELLGLFLGALDSFEPQFNIGTP